MWLLDMVTSVKEKPYTKSKPRRPYPCVIICTSDEDGSPPGASWIGQKQEDAFDLEDDMCEQQKEELRLVMQGRLTLWLRKHAD